ncbi:MAG: hypothetical protein ACYC64_17750 [Armatimonadota bacterium]
MAYIDDTDKGYSLDVYIAATGGCRTVTSRQLQGFASIISYNKKSDCWFVEEDKITSKRTVRICGNKVTPLGSKPRPPAGLSFDSRVKSDGKLLISFLDKEGKLASERELSVPDGFIVGCSSITWSSMSGYIAVDLLLKDVSNSQLYVFDRNARLKDRLGRGSDPQFVANGRRLIYQDMSWSQASDDEIKPSEHGTGNAVIYDTLTRTKRTINIVRSPDAGWDGIADCVGSSDGNWLVCSYTRYPEAKRAVYVVDIRNNGAKWHRLPISVYDGRWTLLDTMPKRFLRR